MFRVDPQEIGWRIVDGCALLVRRDGALYRLNAAATEVWLGAASGSAVAPSRMPWPAGGTGASTTTAFLAALEAERLTARDAESAPAGSPVSRSLPQIRRLGDVTEIAARIRARPGVTSRAVGDGFVVCSPEGTLVTLSADAAWIWRALATGRSTFAALLDGMRAPADVGAEDALVATLSSLSACGLLEAFDSGPRLRRQRPSSNRQAAPIASVCPTGALALMKSGEPVLEPPRIGAGATVREAPADAAHVAIVCQYGIAGLAPGVEAYAKRCLARLQTLNPDLIIVSGGGRHGLADVREGESVVERYRQQLPGRPLWLENYSTTTWENLQHSLEMLQARSIRPRRISFLGDRARAEKLRLCCWIARRRFPAFRHVTFRTVPIARARSTWRDRRLVQLAVGCAQVFGEARRASPAVSMDAS